METGVPQFQNEEYGKPLLALKETGTWSKVIGSENPVFVLYENGQLIYQIIDNRVVKYQVVFLSQKEMDELLKYLSIDESLYDQAREIKPGSDGISFGSEQELALFGKDGPAIAVLYLNTKGNKEKIIYWVIGASTPSAFMNLYNKIKQYHNENAMEWIPPKTEIIFWNYDNASYERQWIEGYPDLDEMETEEAVGINSGKRAVSFIIPFPNLDVLNLIW